jgi:hypothetical protein
MFMFRHLSSASAPILLLMLCTVSTARESRYAQTNSRSDYVHWIDLYDVNNRKIDPTAEDASPYSPKNTCGRCHDYDAISHGFHFNATDRSATHGRPGEPWVWTDERTGTQIPMSYRRWAGTHAPDDLGIAAWDFVLKFGSHHPGGGAGAGPSATEETADEEQAAVEPAEAEAAEADEDAAEDGARWNLAGELEVDCLICHTNSGAYSHEFRWEQIEGQNFAWAPTVAMGLGDVEGSVSRLPDDFDPAAVDENSRNKLPSTSYRPLRVNADQEVFVDVVRRPNDDTCYYCHTTRLVGQDVAPEWTHDQDVHLRAGMSCSDCHRNGIDHHTVRGYEGEQHPTGQSVATLSCRGCHLGDQQQPAGRLGAPKPLHKGLPPLHLERLSCTACHSGAGPAPEAFQEQTARLHRLGLPSHDFTAEMAPGVVTSVLKDDQGRLYPHRMVWPAFWGTLQGDAIQPLNPEVVYEATRKTLRVRRGETFADSLMDVRLSSEDKAAVLGEERAKTSEDELTEEEKAKLEELQTAKGLEAYREKLAAALTDLKEVVTQQDAQPVYVSGGKAFRLGEDGSIVTFDNPAAEPYAWKLGHNVRPAGLSSGVTGCFECHSLDSPIFDGRVTALGPAPDPEPVTRVMHELADLDKIKLDGWSVSFLSRTLFKWFAFGAMGIVAVVILSYLFTGVRGMYGRGR